jgi:uncharacterized protein (DUF1684 family)
VSSATSGDYVRGIEEMRRRRLERLREPDGWLTLVGLEWLHDGENTVGADPDSDVILRGEDAPERAGAVVVDGGAVRFVRAPEADVTLDGQLVDEVELRHDSHPVRPPTVLRIGTLSFHLIRRGDRLGIRVRDSASAARRDFAGIEYFPIDPSWRLVARFEPTPGATIAVPNVIGLTSEEASPGWIVFTRQGVEYRLQALEGDDDRSLWLVFGDATNGRETYGGGRFLYTDPPRPDGSVVVDFNLAYNPPCVFTPYATCDLPPAQNRLALRVEAGERGYGAQVH